MNRMPFDVFSKVTCICFFSGLLMSYVCQSGFPCTLRIKFSLVVMWYSYSVHDRFSL